MVGRVLGGKYEIVRLLGEGGMGAVYEARNIAIQRRVAVKTILHAKAPEAAAVQRFRREAFAMAAVESEHVCGILDAGEDAESGVAFLVMELLTGRDLASVLQRIQRLAPQLVLRIAAQVLAGLRDAHRAGIVHRDLKPSNIFLAARPDGEYAVKLVDFGIARSLAGDDSPASNKVTKAGSVLGTPPYMSPEQLNSRLAMDFRTDLWSLGVVMLEMLSGDNPFDAPDLGQIVARIGFLPLPVVRELAPWVPADVVAVVERALKRDAAERYESAATMLVDVRSLIRGSPVITDAMFVPGWSEERPAASIEARRAAPGQVDSWRDASEPDEPVAPRITGATSAAVQGADASRTATAAAPAAAPATGQPGETGVATRTTVPETMSPGSRGWRRAVLWGVVSIAGAIAMGATLVHFVSRSAPEESGSPDGASSGAALPAGHPPPAVTTRSPDGPTILPSAASPSAPSASASASSAPSVGSAAGAPPPAPQSAQGGPPHAAPRPPSTNSDPFGRGVR